MTIENFMNKAISPWMNQEGPASDIVMSSRVRLARNVRDLSFPTVFTEEEAGKMLRKVENRLGGQYLPGLGTLEMVRLKELQPLERQVLVEKHLISPLLAKEFEMGGVLITENEEVSIMVNEEDHIRIQCLFPGLQLREALDVASRIDDLLENELDYAFDEKLGYLTSCPTNVGTGLRASVMLHLPGLVLTRQMDRIISAINQLGLVVRGMYGEGSEALGNIFQISNQMTLGKTEETIAEDLDSVVKQIIMQEKAARDTLVQSSNIQLEDRVFRSLGILSNARILESKEAAKCLSDVRLGIDLGFIPNITKHILNELMVVTQPGFLQRYAGGPLNPKERDIRRASLIRERLALEGKPIEE